MQKAVYWKLVAHFGPLDFSSTEVLFSHGDCSFSRTSDARRSGGGREAMKRKLSTCLQRDARSDCVSEWVLANDVPLQVTTATVTEERYESIKGEAFVGYERRRQWSR